MLHNNPQSLAYRPQRGSALQNGSAPQVSPGNPFARRPVGGDQFVQGNQERPKATVPQAIIQTNGALHLYGVPFRGNDATTLVREIPRNPYAPHGTLADAARAGDVSLLHYFLSNMPAGTIRQPVENDGSTLLHLVARKAKHPAQALQYLVKNGASVRAADDSGFTPVLEMACRKPKDQDIHGVDFLLRHGGDVNSACETGLSLFDALVRNNADNPVPAVQRLIAHNVDLNQPSESGMLPLFVVARFCRNPYNVMRLMLQAYPHDSQRCPVLDAVSVMQAQDTQGENARTYELGTALIALAYYSPNPQPALRLLAQAGASVAQARQTYPNVFPLSANARSYSEVEDLLRGAATANQPEPGRPTVPEQDGLVQEPVQPLNVQPVGIEEHNLCSAAEAGRLDLVQFYLARLPDHFSRPSRGKEKSALPLAHAAMGGHLKTVQFIVENFATLREQGVTGDGVDINAVHNGMTALSWAIAHKRQKVVAYLLSAGADPMIEVRRKHGLLTPNEFYPNAFSYALKTSDVQCATSVLEWIERHENAIIDVKKTRAAIQDSGKKLMLERFDMVMRKRVTGK